MYNNNGIVRNGFYIKDRKRNGKIECVQSLKNEKFYVSVYDENKHDFVMMWIDKPKFLR